MSARRSLCPPQHRCTATDAPVEVTRRTEPATGEGSSGGRRADSLRAAGVGYWDLGRWEVHGPAAVVRARP
jgi:hypothetical protein